MYAEVIVDIANSEVDRIFDYKTIDGVTEGSRVLVPFGPKKIHGVVIGIKEKTDLPPEKVKPIYGIMDDFPAITEECLKLMFYVKERYHVPAALALRLFLPTEMRLGKVRPQTAVFYSLSPSLPPDRILADIGSRALKQREAVEFIAKEGKCASAALREKFGVSAVTALLKKGYLVEIKERTQRSPYSELAKKFNEVELTKAQTNAIEEIENSNSGISLLHGVTGSGKTEVYLNLINSAVKSGKTAIMLVPEISLTPQMLSQLRARFGDAAAILHSGLSAGERFDEWWRLRSGQARIAIGARSAVFAPVENVGVIIIDEEHDGSYSSDTAPRYSTVEIAECRRKYNNCKLVLGSATPSIEAYAKALSGKYDLVKMPERINKKPLPEILIADMKNEICRGNNSMFSAALRDELKKCLKGGNQAIIFLNRRGYSRTLVCHECGYVAKCDACDISLTYHLDVNRLKCHFCGNSYKMPEACPECGSTRLHYGGIGTEKVVEELGKLFPEAKILRMDNDTTRNKDGHYKILKEFGSHNADILVGTQMIAKGHDFPSVTLVGILDADMSLFYSDYRSRERTFQLLTQVSGRSGRADKKGIVVLQTYNPENQVLQYAIRYDYEGFIRSEIELRKATGFPPFADILRVMVVSEDEGKAIATLKDVYDETLRIRDANDEDFIFFNKMRSPVKRAQNKFRFQVLMRINAERPELKNKIYESALKYSNKDVLVYMEENPDSLV